MRYSATLRSYEMVVHKKARAGFPDRAFASSLWRQVSSVPYALP
jgi:hypothetical protein